MRCCCVGMCVLFVVVLAATVSRAAEITVERTKQGAAVKIDGQLFAEYVTKSNTKPILWPIIGPTGKRMTREYPMKKVDSERKKDHPHHRSLWFTHGSVNGVDFWDEASPKKCGTTQHIEFLKTESGKPAVIATRNAWLAPGGKKVCEDVRTLRFDTDGDARWIDFDINLKATDGPVTFGDTKEGTFGIRVPESMNVDSRRGGQIVNSENQTDGKAWAKRASWVDYHGPVDGETVGIAILNHPTSFRYPTYWHVRTYGLFAANPFGVHDFVPNAARDAGQFTLPAGQSVTFRYRVLLHRGDEKAGKVAEAFAQYAKEK
jgi:hypothetical protein